MSCGLVQLIKAGFVFDTKWDTKWDAKFEQLEKCELPASRAQQVT